MWSTIVINENITEVARISNSSEVASYYSKGKLVYNQIPEFRQQLEKISTYLLHKLNIIK